MASIKMALIGGVKTIRASIEMDSTKMAMIGKASTSRVSAMRASTEKASIPKEWTEMDIHEKQPHNTGET